MVFRISQTKKRHFFLTHDACNALTDLEKLPQWGMTNTKGEKSKVVANLCSRPWSVHNDSFSTYTRLFTPVHEESMLTSELITTPLVSPTASSPVSEQTNVVKVMRMYYTSIIPTHIPPCLTDCQNHVVKKGSQRLYPLKLWSQSFQVVTNGDPDISRVVVL